MCYIKEDYLENIHDIISTVKLNQLKNLNKLL